MITNPISSNFCNVIGFTIFFRSSHYRCSGRKGVFRYFTKFTEKHLWQSLFLTSFSRSLSRVFSNISYLFHFNRIMKWKKGNTLTIYFLARVSICLTSKTSKEIWQMVIWSKGMFKGNLMLQFSWLEEFY